MRVYLDTAPSIYMVERISPYASVASQRLSMPEIILVASDLTRMECRIMPLRMNNTTLLQEYDDFFAQTVNEIIGLSRQVMDYAAEVRAQFGFKTPDAIHLAAAVVAGCDVFYTNDLRLDKFPHLTVEVVIP